MARVIRKFETSQGRQIFRMAKPVLRRLAGIGSGSSVVCAFSLRKITLPCLKFQAVRTPSRGMVYCVGVEKMGLQLKNYRGFDINIGENRWRRNLNEVQICHRLLPQKIMAVGRKERGIRKFEW